MSNRSEKYTTFGEIDYGHDEKIRLEWVNSIDRLPTEEERTAYRIMWQGVRPVGLPDSYGAKWCKVSRK